MVNWIKKWLGYHICEEFTRWEEKHVNFSRSATMEEYVFGHVRTVEFTKRWQERCCTICGKIQQRPLKNYL